MELDDIFLNATNYWINSTVDNGTSNFSASTNATRGASTNGVCSAPAYFYSMGVVIPSGLISNVFCLVVFTLSAGLRRTTTGHYLTALACADSLFLVGDFMRWLNTDGCTTVDFRNTSEIACKLIFWLRYGAKLVSAWVTVAIATERFITVAFPLKVSSLSTAGRAKIVIVLLFFVGFCLGSYTLWTLDLVHPIAPGQRIMCKVVPKFQNAYNAWNTSVLIVGTIVVPGAIISILTTITVVILMRASRRRREHMEGQPVLASSYSAGGASASNGPLRKTTSAARGSSAERQLTVTLVAVCLAFMVLRLPYAVCYFLSQVLAQRRLPGLSVAVKVTDVIATSNYVVNLMLYCLCGSYFRQQVLVVYGCRRRRRNGTFGGPVVRLNSITKDSMDYSYKSRCSTATRMSIF